MPVRWQVSPESSICFESASNIGYSFSYSQDPQVQESKAIVPLTIALPVPKTLSSSDLEDLGPTTIIQLNWKLRLPCGHSGLLMPLSQQAKKGITVLGVVIDPDYHEEIGFFVHN